ncbi:MAG TPA: glutamate--tRNA ligase [Phycisphaerae bacterium]|nr:glutamate--tRNA ligase [Phycisphaerae bacterium]
MASDAVRVRFAPSPTGYLHVGGARTALFNWLLARRSPSGRFVLRIEDTDRNRHVEDSVQKILSDLRWLGLDWDEGPEVGGDFGPYHQSERLGIYQTHIDRLLAEGKAYYAFETPDELNALRERARAAKQDFRYPRPDPLPTAQDAGKARAEGRPVVVRLLMPERAITVVDDILGNVTLEADQLDDFVLLKADGWPTYHFACVVDDALMKITHVLRGQEHLMNTPRHIALQEALGFTTPRYAHLPVIFNTDGSKMSKRDKEKALKRGEIPPEIEVHDFRSAGYLPEALMNFLTLLGWSTGDDIEQITLDETVKRFSVAGIGKSNAKFDRSKLLAFNTDWAARVAPDRLLGLFKDYLAVNDAPMAQADDATLRLVLELCAGFRTFRDVEAKAGFAFVPDDAIVYDEKAVQKVLAKNDGAGFAMLEQLVERLAALAPWSAEAVEAELHAVAEGAGGKLGAVAQPLRVAVSGGTVSPAIGATLELVGREGTLRRMRRALELRTTLQTGQ